MYQIWLPSNYNLSRNLKRFVHGNRSSLNEGALSVNEQYFADFQEIHYRDGIKLSQDDWNKGIEAEGD